jgi:hypothetical protein
MPIEVKDMTKRRTRHQARPPVDVQRVARAVRSPGIDSRSWFEAGTVGVENEEGDFVTDDPEAIYVDQLGAVVSVRLEPSGEIVTARYNGIACGRMGFMLVPIRPGDEVLVAIPNGDYNSPAVTIVGVASNQTAQIPTNWNNDRVLFQLNVPLEIRAPILRIDSNQLALNGRLVAFGPEGI